MEKKHNRINTKKNAFDVDKTVKSTNPKSKPSRTKPNDKAVQMAKSKDTGNNSQETRKPKSGQSIRNNKARKILVVVDVQNDFITGVLGNKDCQTAAKRIVEKLTTEADKYDAFYFTRDVHFDNYLETLEGQKLPIAHCIDGTEGCDFVNGIQDAIKYLRKNGKYIKVITKHTFGSNTLADILNATCRATDEIELCGVCTDICVVSNALSLRQAMPNRVIKVNPSYCAGTSRAAHKAALRTMNSCQIDIIAGGNY